MFENLCFFNGTSWHGISYKGGGMGTHHGERACFDAAVVSVSCRGPYEHTADVDRS